MTAASYSRVFGSPSLEETLALGKAIGQALVGELVIGLIGPLGAGKTFLTKGIAIGNGLSDSGDVTSPTFTLIQEYRGRLLIYHLDLYRLNRVQEFTMLGFDEMIRPDSVVIVEWADRMPGVLPDDRVMVTLTADGPSSRRITIAGSGPRSNQFVESIDASAVSQ